MLNTMSARALMAERGTGGRDEPKENAEMRGGSRDEGDLDVKWRRRTQTVKERNGVLGAKDALNNEEPGRPRVDGRPTSDVVRM